MSSRKRRVGGEYHGIHCSDDACGGRNIDNVKTWYWNNSTYDWDIYAHVFDQNGKRGTTDNIPIRYANNSTSYRDTNNIPQCTSDYSITSGHTLHSNIANQYSCNPDTLNAGNWYNYPAATAGSDNKNTSTATNIRNSICPKGWRLPPNSGDKSYNTLIRTAYNISDTDSDTNFLANSAMSFVHLGNYSYSVGSLNYRGTNGSYWSSTTSNATDSRRLYFYSRDLSPQNSRERASGFSVRCVSREAPSLSR